MPEKLVKINTPQAIWGKQPLVQAEESVKVGMAVGTLPEAMKAPCNVKAVIAPEFLQEKEILLERGAHGC